jgi:hypothetical protein
MKTNTHAPVRGMSKSVSGKDPSGASPVSASESVISNDDLGQEQDRRRHQALKYRQRVATYILAFVVTCVIITLCVIAILRVQPLMLPPLLVLASPFIRHLIRSAEETQPNFGILFSLLISILLTALRRAK